MSCSGYVVVPRCSVIFDGTNYAKFVGFMCIHMRGLLLWGVLSGEVPCPPCSVAPVATTPPVPPVLATEASQADRDAAKALNDSTADAYDQQVSAHSDAPSVYRDDLSAYTQWCNDDARAAAVLTTSVLPQFASEFMGSVLLQRCGPTSVSTISPLAMPYTSLWCARSMLSSRVIRLWMSSTHSVLPSGVSLTH